jgi:predicted acetyltransferase
MAEITYRPVREDEIPAFFQANSYGFSHDFDPQADWIAGLLKFADFGRSTAAIEDGEIVGTAGIYSFAMTVPGATLPTAGVTWVSVRPTHRRRGVLTGMMRTQMDAVRERGEAIAALWASESPIYGQFGYGLAAEGVEMHIDRTRTALRHVTPFSGRTHYVDREEALATWPAVYEKVRTTIPGMISRTPAWWANRQLRTQERPSPGYTKSFRVTYEEAGEALGYVSYRVNETDHEGSPTSTLRIGELMAATDAAYSALWSFVFGVDLMGTIVLPWGRADEPLAHMLADPRRLVRRPQDTIYVRLVDVVKALEGRRYSDAGEIVIAVDDRFCTWNSGRYALAGGPDGATCKPTDAPVDVSLTAETLGALYLGGARFQAMARAGRVSGSAEALRRADAMFAWDPLPWIPEVV